MKSLIDIWKYLKSHRKYWLLPLLFLLLLFGLIIILAGNAAVAPFIYTLF